MGDAQTLKSEAAQREEAILMFWKERRIFEKTLEQEAPEGEFVFYEGPPTANGRPGIHHLEARAFKDLIPRYRTMRGFRVYRKGGWDTHGLPVELEVEKKLGMQSKKDIETYGIAAFNEACRESVWTYVDEWRRFTERIGFWVDVDHAYVTYDPRYMESLWYVIKRVHERGLLYKDYKVLPWCPRCGTGLSSHELAQGYKEVEDMSAYVKFKIAGERNTFLLAWTTTPWTLPGNVALAVGAAITYCKARVADEIFILAKERLSLLPEGAVVLEELSGSALVGLAYEPLFPFLNNLAQEREQEQLHKAYRVYVDDFVTTDEGTGIVHIAVMYGQDDFALGNKTGLPKVHLVDEAGRFVAGTDELAGRFVKDGETERLLFAALEAKDALFKKEPHTHTYPFCWRCKTPVIYYAHDSWYIAMSQLRDELIRENKSIRWEPEHIRDGRFGEWLEGIKDWAISRDRFWGTPLPLWHSEDGTERVVIGSLAELKAHTKKSGNSYLAVRHGESTYFAEGIYTIDPEGKYGLTEQGVEHIRALAAQVPQEKPLRILYSPVRRTKESAEILARELRVPVERMHAEPRLREIGFGICEGKPQACFRHVMEQAGAAWYTAKAEGGESNDDVRMRVAELLYELEARYANETILLVTHEAGVQALAIAADGLSNSSAATRKQETDVPPGSLHEISFVPLPHNARFELDLHRPYIDDLEVVGTNGTPLTRVREVMDVWFDSGAMPFAQDHYPFENRERIDSGAGYPAGFISEAIDQTRGWFYTLHAIGALMGKGKAFGSVICLGHILDGEGKKMSKSLGNMVNPWEMIEKYGVDALRFWMYSVNQPGDSKNFDERTVDDIVKKVFNLLTNVVKFYEQYAGPMRDEPRADMDAEHIRAATNPLDQWILARLDQLALYVAGELDCNHVFEPARAIREFIADLSQWYIRRSRDRFKSADPQEKVCALATTRMVLRDLAKVMAPFTPFLAEQVYQHMRGPEDAESVHLERWPQMGVVDEEILARMAHTRTIASEALELRAKAGIKIRQPLAALTVPEGPLLYEDILKEELNVKAVRFGAALALDTALTPELREEGDVRELIRAIQDLRKRAGLNPGDTITLGIETDDRGRALIEKNRISCTAATGITDIIFAAQPEGEMVKGESWNLMHIAIV